MKTLIYNLPVILDFLNERIPGGSFEKGLPCVGMLEDGKLVGAVAYNHYTGNAILMHVAGAKRGWVTRKFLRAAFNYPFHQLGCTRVTGLVRTDNPVAQDFDERIGFKREGLIREGDDDGCDLILYGMLKRECRWID